MHYFYNWQTHKDLIEFLSSQVTVYPVVLVHFLGPMDFSEIPFWHIYIYIITQTLNTISWRNRYIWETNQYQSLLKNPSIEEINIVI